MTEPTPQQPTDRAPMPEPQVEWAVEVTWLDWKRAGAKGPTSQFGPFETEESRDRFIDTQRRDRDIAGTRILSRLAAYTPWEGPEEVEATTEEDRNERLDRLHAEMFAHLSRPSEGGGEQ